MVSEERVRGLEGEHVLECGDNSAQRGVGTE